MSFGQNNKQDIMQNPDDFQRPTGLLNRSWSEWFSTLPVFLLLILTLVIGTGEMIHGQLLRVGERLFGDEASNIQYSYLRADPTLPTCNRGAVTDAMVQNEINKPADTEFGDLFGDVKKDPAQVRQSLESAQTQCQEKFAFYDNVSHHITPSLRAYRGFETAFFAIFRFGTENRALILVLMVAIAAITTTLGLHHIALRPPSTKKDFQVYSVSMTVANALLAYSSILYYFSQKNAGVELETVGIVINVVWISVFSALTVISAYKLFNPPKDALEGGSFGLATLSVPLYANMALIAGITFIFFMGYPTGSAIYLGQMVEFSQIFLNLALYVWAGMLLKQTRVVDLFLNLLRPWNFSPETLTWIILLAAAIPTAYTGASGIFVIAAGAIIYKEVYNSGARRQYALAATAMSGSLGVVLRPCLLIVVIAAMNKEVTTDLLYAKGLYVFAISSTLFLIVSLFLAEQKFRIASPAIALPATARALVPISPYILITIAVIGFYQFGLDTKMDEFTAPMIMPFILLALVAFDKLRREPVVLAAVAAPVSPVVSDAAPVSPYLRTADADGKNRRVGFEQAMRFATNETIGHIGALIMLMALSVSIGGLIERSEIMLAVPADMGSTVVAITLLVGLMVFIGMVMDPFGAVILVSATVAPVAYNNGINPVHFWMIVLTAFELGYLSPPVALNQLLARQVVGEKEMAEADAEVRHLSFYYRYERWILPVVVMAITLMLVSYLPYYFKMFGWYQ
jgi:TRAP-type C4-dicarboxylate transport system permease large subunit